MDGDEGLATEHRGGPRVTHVKMQEVAKYGSSAYSVCMVADREAVELFHLHFVRLLFAGRDKAHFVVKGGCNLRFFFGSVRYSEDLDLDARAGAVDALRDRADSILGSKVLREVLESASLEIGHISKPKQTPTTQRWKIELRPRDRDSALNTKIEFSRREQDGVAALEAVNQPLLLRHRLAPILANHYVLSTAIRQKVGALVGRREVQARDVFDLSLLLARAGSDLAALEDLRPLVPKAVERSWELSYSDYAGQVVAFLEPEHAATEGSEEAWEAKQLQVVSALESLGRPS